MSRIEKHHMWDLGARRRIKCKQCDSIATRTEAMSCECGAVRLEFQEPYLVVEGVIGEWEVEKV